MSVTSNLKKQVDLPVYEWLRPMPVATVANSAFTTANSLSARYIYYVNASAFYRYDTVTDSWHQLATSATLSLTEIGYTSSMGHYGRAIAGGASSIELAGLVGNALVGQKIRIISGKGAGQERTITAITDPIIKDRGVVTTGSAATIIDASTGFMGKNWRPNQWRDYQVRVIYGTDVTQVRPILYNNATQLTVYDANWSGCTPWFGAQFTANTATASNGTSTLYQIESNIATVDTPWVNVPDDTSQFVILSGGIWLITASASAPFFSLLYYDVLTDVWYNKTCQSGLILAQLGTDVTFERFTETGGAILTGTATSGGSASLTDSLMAATPGRYVNFEIRITGGTGIGQTRTIVGNTPTAFLVGRAWDTIPDATSTYSVYRDCGTLLMSGHGASAMYQYSVDSDQWTTGRRTDFGTCRRMSATRAGVEPMGINAITSTASGVVSLTAPTVIAAAGSGYSVDQVLGIAVTGSPQIRVTSVDANGGVTGVILESPGSGGSSAGTYSTTLASPVQTYGAGCQITLVTADISAIAYAATSLSHNFKLGDTVVIAGATGATTGYNGSKVIIGLAGVGGFYYALATTLAGATYVDHSTLSITDVNKNWATNALAGKIIQVSSAGPAATGFARRISANTSNTISWVGTGGSPGNGVSRYTIHDPKPFATEISPWGKVGGGRAGVATGGSTTTLVDSGKSWPTNCWSHVQNSNISSFATGTGVTTITTSAAHNLTTGQTVVMTGCGVDYNGVWVVTVTGSTTFTIAKSYVAFAATAASICTLLSPSSYLVISAFATYSGGAATKVTTSTAHGRLTGDTVVIGNTANYNGYWVVTVIDSTNFSISRAYVSESPAGGGYTGSYAAPATGRRKLLITAGANSGFEVPILSNTSDTLTVPILPTAIDTTSVYEIMDNFGKADAGSSTTLLDSTQNWGTNALTGKRVKFITGAGQGQEYLILSNTSNTLTFSTATAPDSTTCYAILELPARGAGIHMDCVTGSSVPAVNNKYIYMWRGGVTSEISRYDFTTEQVDFITYFPLTETLTAGSMFVYDGADRIYFTKESTNRVMSYDVTTNLVSPASTIPYGMSTALIGNRMEIVQTEDGLKFLYIGRHSGQEFWRTLLFW